MPWANLHSALLEPPPHGPRDGHRAGVVAMDAERLGLDADDGPVPRDGLAVERDLQRLRRCRGGIVQQRTGVNPRPQSAVGSYWRSANASAATRNPASFHTVSICDPVSPTSHRSGRTRAAARAIAAASGSSRAAWLYNAPWGFT